MGIGSNLDIVPYFRICYYSILHRNATANYAVFQTTTWADYTIFSYDCTCFDHSLRIYYRILAYTAAQFNIGTAWIDNSNSALHQFSLDPLLHNLFCL